MAKGKKAASSSPKAKKQDNTEIVFTYLVNRKPVKTYTQAEWDKLSYEDAVSKISTHETCKKYVEPV
jgi:hypothetical protein